MTSFFALATRDSSRTCAVAVWGLSSTTVGDGGPKDLVVALDLFGVVAGEGTGALRQRRPSHASQCEVTPLNDLSDYGKSDISEHYCAHLGHQLDQLQCTDRSMRQCRVLLLTRTARPRRRSTSHPRRAPRGQIPRMHETILRTGGPSRAQGDQFYSYWLSIARTCVVGDPCSFWPRITHTPSVARREPIGRWCLRRAPTATRYVCRRAWVLCLVSRSRPHADESRTNGASYCRTAVCVQVDVDLDRVAAV